MAFVTHCNLKAVPRRSSHLALFWPNLYRACAQTAIAKLPINIPTPPLIRPPWFPLWYGRLGSLLAFWAYFHCACAETACWKDNTYVYSPLGRTEKNKRRKMKKDRDRQIMHYIRLHKTTYNYTLTQNFHSTFREKRTHTLIYVRKFNGKVKFIYGTDVYTIAILGSIAGPQCHAVSALTTMLTSGRLSPQHCDHVKFF